MNYLPVIYSRARTIGSFVIRLADRQGGQMCDYSHVGIISECGNYVYESLIGQGVVKTSINEFRHRASKVDEGLFPCVNPSESYDKLTKELGKPYDYFGAISLGIPFVGRDWEKQNSWWCSELLAHASGMFEQEKIRTIGVAFCWSMTKPK